MVAAKETTLQELLEGSKQYRVPLYQRTYSWGSKQLEQLWADVVLLAEDRADDPSQTHFIGSLVLTAAAGNGPAGVQEYLVVDGQQRLTTLSLLLCALRDHQVGTESADHRERINEQYLVNKWQKNGRRLKFVPTQADRASYLACVDETAQAGGRDAVGSAYNHFRQALVRLESRTEDGEVTLDAASIEAALLHGLSLVAVTAQEGDNAHRIFESLNNTGLQLTQGDLLRNYVFMRLSTTADSVYQSVWLPLQESLSSEELEQLFWLDLVRRDARVKQSDIYLGQQRRLDRLSGEAAIEQDLKRLERLGRLFGLILEPAREADGDVRRGLRRLRDWGTTTVRPLLLELLDRREQGRATSAEISRAMLYVESFLIRRLLIGRATAGINRVLLGVVTEMADDNPVDESVRAYLSSGRKHFASDDELRAAVESVPLYLHGRPQQRALVLRWVEETYGSKEPVDASSLTIEHVLPQTLTAAWESELAADAEDDEVASLHAGLVHTLGNLTLTGYNSSLSNKPFSDKRALLSTSGVAMNQEIASQERWGRRQINARSGALADRIITTWPGPVEGGNVDAESGAKWTLMEQALAAMPAGMWTTYKDLAVLIGTAALPVGQRLSSKSAPHAYRVLQADGRVAAGFAWLDPGRVDTPRELLEAEGVLFDDAGRADSAQRLYPDALAALIGLGGGNA